uniref:Uncharacterized protein n=1 Tax=Anguilla anguilla TaxID=7936 RepID=A0A0E9VG60_ANGAN
MLNDTMQNGQLTVFQSLLQIKLKTHQIRLERPIK